MNRIFITIHACQRMQQRGISELQIQLIEHFGVNRLQKGGSSVSYTPQKTLIELRHAIDKISDKAAVVSECDEVVTVMHRNRRIHTTRYAA